MGKLVDLVPKLSKRSCNSSNALLPLRKSVPTYTKTAYDQKELSMIQRFKNSRNYESKITQLSEFAAANDVSHQTFKEIADSYESMGYVEDAIENYERSLVIKSNNVRVCVRLADCYDSLGDFRQAQFYIQMAHKNSRTVNPYLYYQKGLLYCETDIPKSIKYFKYARWIANQQSKKDEYLIASIEKGLAFAYIDLGIFDNAIDLLENLHKKNHMNEETLDELKNAYKETGNYNKLFECMETEVQFGLYTIAYNLQKFGTYPENINRILENIFALANAYIQKNDYKKTLKCLNEGINTGYDQSEYYNKMVNLKKTVKKVMHSHKDIKNIRTSLYKNLLTREYKSFFTHQIHKDIHSPNSISSVRLKTYLTFLGLKNDSETLSKLYLMFNDEIGTKKLEKAIVNKLLPLFNLSDNELSKLVLHLFNNNDFIRNPIFISKSNLPLVSGIDEDNQIIYFSSLHPRFRKPDQAYAAACAGCDFVVAKLQELGVKLESKSIREFVSKL